MKRRYDVTLYYELLDTYFNLLETETDFSAYFFDGYYQGKQQLELTEDLKYKKFDNEWLKKILAYYPSLDRITKNMKTTLKYDTEITNIEKVKYIDQESIKHLSQHTEYILEVNEFDEVIPEKLLTPLSDIEINLYENRFVATLIIRLTNFLKIKINEMENHLNDERVLTLNNKTTFTFNKANYDLKVELKQKENLSSKIYELENLKVIEETKYVFKLISNLLNTPFINLMKKYKPVSSPINKTQTIQKNPDYLNAYQLWMHLDKLSQTDLGQEIKKEKIDTTGRFNTDVDRFALQSISTLIAHDLGKDNDFDNIIDLRQHELIKHKRKNERHQELKNRKDLFKELIQKSEEKNLFDIPKNTFDTNINYTDDLIKNKNLVKDKINELSKLRKQQHEVYLKMLKQEEELIEAYFIAQDKVEFMERVNITQKVFDELNQIEKHDNEVFKQLQKEIKVKKESIEPSFLLEKVNEIEDKSTSLLSKLTKEKHEELIHKKEQLALKQKSRIEKLNKS